MRPVKFFMHPNLRSYKMHPNLWSVVCKCGGSSFPTTACNFDAPNSKLQVSWQRHKTRHVQHTTCWGNSWWSMYINASIQYHSTQYLLIQSLLGPIFHKPGWEFSSSAFFTRIVKMSIRCWYSLLPFLKCNQVHMSIYEAERGSWWFLSQANSKLEGTHCFSDVIYFSEQAWLSTWYMSGLNGHTKVLVTSLVPWTWEKGHMCSQTKEAMGSRDVFSHSLDFWVVNMKGLQLSFPHER